MSSQAGFYSSKRQYYSRPIRPCLIDINNIVTDKKKKQYADKKKCGKEWASLKTRRHKSHTLR